MVYLEIGAVYQFKNHYAVNRELGLDWGFGSVSGRQFLAVKRDVGTEGLKDTNKRSD